MNEWQQLSRRTLSATLPCVCEKGRERERETERGRERESQEELQPEQSVGTVSDELTAVLSFSPPLASFQFPPLV